MASRKLQSRASLSSAYHPGCPVWVPEKAQGPDGNLKAARWLKGKVVSLVRGPDGTGLLEVQTEEGTTVTLAPLECPLQNERDDTVDDLVKSDFLHEPGILHTLRVRYTLDMIYTYSGNILIAANPHKRVRQLYGGRMMTQYRGVPLGELSPHVYAIAEQAFSAMMIDEQRQAILISGESGAGKTESAKMVMQYLAHRTAPLLQSQASMKPKAQGVIGSAAAGSAPIEEQVLESNPLLEAFGNAKTSRNDNSSRFGKFVQIEFDVAGRVNGAAISTYLLERSRVVSINSPERSYHIFYQLCAGAPPHLQKLLRLEKGAEGFHYLSGSETYQLDGVDDGEGLRTTLDAMAIIGLREQEREAVLRVVAAVMHLGNIGFKTGGADDAVLDGGGSQEALHIVAGLLQVEPEALFTALTTRAIEAMRERIVKRLSAAAACESRDSLAKSLYARLFEWLVAAINRKISALGSGQGSHRVIGILDIYGFESFKENSFEQLCINLANERLQQQFNQHIFKGEQEEYAREGIDWSYVEFVDNQDCLDLLEGTASAPGLAVFPLIDEACRLPRATYQDLAYSLRTRLADHPRFVAPKRPPHAFQVDHYAGKVLYAATALMEKNKDFTVAEHSNLMASSSFDFIRLLFEEPEPEAAPTPPPGGKLGPNRGGKSAFKLNSVGVQFRGQLKGLMADLNQCSPHYIRCIKPNPESKPGKLAPEYALEQLRAGGVLEAVRIASAGFPTRKAFKPFAQRYNVLLAVGKGMYKALDMDTLDEARASELSRQILQVVRLHGWQIGKTRVFLRAGQLAQLEGARGRRLTESALYIQAAWRGYKIKRDYRRQRQAVMRIQAGWRGLQGRKLAKQLRRERAVTTIAATWRMVRARRVFKRRQNNRRATVIQAAVRGWLQRLRFRRATELGKRQAARTAAVQKRVSAAVVLQKHSRRYLANKRVARMREEQRKWREMQDSNRALQDEVASWKARFKAEAARSDELAADVSKLSAALSVAEAAAGELRQQQANMQPRVNESERFAAMDAAREAEVRKEAQETATASLVAELEILRRQKAAAEESTRRLDMQVEEATETAKSAKANTAALEASAQAKDKENAKLWAQVTAAAEGYQAAIAEKDAHIAALAQEAEHTRVSMQADIDKLRTDMEAEVAAAHQAMESRVQEAVDETQSKQTGLRDARERNVHFSARVVALNSRVGALQRQLKEAQARERQLMADQEIIKEAARKAVTEARAATPRQLQLSENGMMQHPSYAQQRRMSHSREGSLVDGEGDMSHRSPHFSHRPPSVAGSDIGDAVGDWVQDGILSQEQQTSLTALQQNVVQRRLPILTVQYGTQPKDSIGMPTAAWILGECLLRWASVWKPTEVEAAATRVRDNVLSTAEAEGLTYQAYWLSATLALGAFLKVRSIGKRDYAGLFKLGDEMIQFAPLHSLLASSVADMVPVNTSILMSEDAKRQARTNAYGDGLSSTQRKGGKSFEDLMTSPWKGLLGGLSNVLETLKGEGLPPSACRAVVHGCLRYVDAELLNALMLRRETCSISAIKALQAGVADMRAWVAYMGPQLCGDAADADQALEHSLQASRYLLSGKDECVRRAAKGAGDITAWLRGSFSALTLQQIYRLTEHHHDDWITGGQMTGTVGLLETLKGIVEQSSSGSFVRPRQPQSPASPSHSDQGMHRRDASMASHASLVSLGGAGEDEDTLLLDSHAAFVLPRKLLTEAARYFVQAPKSANSASPGISLLDRIEMSCRSNAQLPRGLRDRMDFAFLKSAR
ncbi:hypothetical protein WJX73_007169 [Symbiochloris irregularis]|uniref:Uncharacterized protein n=1 Tax=Symbiochloris irregularis TaxID=706552 RepID=A0AAW1NVR2_9CHLO